MADVEYWNGGLPYIAGGVAVDEEGPIAYWHQGLPFSAEHYLCVEVDAPVVTRGSGAAAYGSSGFLSVTESAAVSWQAAVGYDSEGRVSMATQSPP